jgi:hypothetical protein
MDNNKHVIIEIIESVHSSKGALCKPSGKEGDWNENTREFTSTTGCVTLDMV